MKHSLLLYSSFITIFILGLVNCGSKISNKEALTWFHTNYDKLKVINTIISQSPSIVRVSPKQNERYVRNRRKFTQEEVVIYRKLVTLSKNIDISSIQSYKDETAKKLIVNSYTLASSGMTGEGTSTGIKYIPDDSYIESQNDKYNEYSYTKINEEGWYIVNYKSKKGISY